MINNNNKENENIFVSPRKRVRKVNPADQRLIFDQRLNGFTKNNKNNCTIVVSSMITWRRSDCFFLLYISLPFHNYAVAIYIPSNMYDSFKPKNLSLNQKQKTNGIMIYSCLISFKNIWNVIYLITIVIIWNRISWQKTSPEEVNNNNNNPFNFFCFVAFSSFKI